MPEITKFYVKNEGSPEVLAVLEYAHDTHIFALHISRDLPKNAPLFLTAYANTGFYDLTPEQAIVWVRNRIVPPNRANIGEILASYGLNKYDEFEIIRKTKGYCPQDDLYLEEVRSL